MMCRPQKMQCHSIIDSDLDRRFSISGLVKSWFRDLTAKYTIHDLLNDYINCLPPSLQDPEKCALREPAEEKNITKS